MALVLKIVGWFCIAVSLANGSLKILGDVETVARYAGGTRNLDLNLTVIAFCLIFLGLAAILDRLDES